MKECTSYKKFWVKKNNNSICLEDRARGVFREKGQFPADIGT